MNATTEVMVLVHPGEACLGADAALGDAAPCVRDALAAEVMAWPHDLLIVDGETTRQVGDYALLALAIENAADRSERVYVRETACASSVPDGWTDAVRRRFDAHWPGGPHRVVVTGAWSDGHGGCVDAVAALLADHAVTVSSRAMRRP